MRALGLESNEEPCGRVSTTDSPQTQAWKQLFRSGALGAQVDVGREALERRSVRATGERHVKSDLKGLDGRESDLVLLLDFAHLLAFLVDR